MVLPYIALILLLISLIDVSVSDHMDSSMSARCKGKPEMTYWPLPEDCQQFYVCIDQHTFVMDCPFDLYYDRTRNMCRAFEEVDCSPEPTKKPHHHHHTTTTHKPKHTTKRHHTTTKKPKTTTKAPKTTKSTKKPMKTKRKTTTRRPKTTTEGYESESSEVIATGVLPRRRGSGSHEFENAVDYRQSDYDADQYDDDDDEYDIDNNNVDDYQETSSQVECCNFDRSECWDC